jgi:formylglycine-generating enzyme required for sulfatase activity
MNKVKMLGIITVAVIIVIGMSAIISCDNGSDDECTHPKAIVTCARTQTCTICGFEIKPVAHYLNNRNCTELCFSLKMESIEGGKFMMGQSVMATPIREVTLSGFKMSRFQVTQELFQEIMGYNSSYYHGGTGREPAVGEKQGKRPVELVTWFDAIEFCNKLSEKEKLTPVYTITDIERNPNNNNNIRSASIAVNWSNNGYRLPTEAQWEYACRAGSTGSWHCDEADLEDYAWFSTNAENKTHEVGKKTPNDWNLYDMHGNVSEWCWDGYSVYPSGAVTNPTGSGNSPSRVRRGGSIATSNALLLGSACRYYSPPENWAPEIGFRLVLPPDN